MSSTGQAFVKSFARRSQTNSTKAVATQTVQRTGSPSRPERLADAGERTTAAKVAELESAELWIDSFDDSSLRLDRAAGSVPTPNLHTRSPQNTPTAYDSTGSDSTNQSGTDDRTHRESTRNTAASNRDPANESLAQSESPEAILAARVAKVLQPAQAKTESIKEFVAPETNSESDHRYHAVEEDFADTSEAQTGSKFNKNFQTSEALHPNWEVEVFDIPQSVADLFFEETLFQDLSDRMKEASQGGLRTMLMTSALTGEGRTTVAIGVALSAASSGLRVALVDGDLAEPTLAEELRLDLDHSWVESIRRGVPIKEIAVHAVEDNLTLIPLLPTDSGRQATAVECAQLIESIKPSFDLIIVDGPTADARDIRMLGSAIDSVIIVHDVNQSSDAAADLLAARLQRSGIDGVGIVENFV